MQFKPNSHQIAVRNLEHQEFETFLPLHEVTRRTAVKFETVIRPLFPGYMFVTCDTEQAPWRQINSTHGISRMLSFAEGLKPMPEALIVGLRAWCDSVCKLTHLKSFEAGRSVEMGGLPNQDRVKDERYEIHQKRAPFLSTNLYTDVHLQWRKIPVRAVRINR